MTQLHPAVSPMDHIAGPAHAPVTLVEYGDYQCPHCGHAHPIVKAIQLAMGDSLRFVFRNFPLAEIHPHASTAAQAAETAASAGSGAFWAMHDAMFEHQDHLDIASLGKYAVAAGVDPETVRQAISHGTFVDRVNSDFLSGVRSGVNGTPTFFVNGQRYDGEWWNAEAFLADLALASRAVHSRMT